ncbi:GNAT family N-acetyltransferase [Risungbinella massiliensis]|uniref:GNAT family N-acetyltransferase n=1 Tax=Risungbinella massiliensis TaxID=1329796 RepID=UPI0005CC0B25|nr:GNAT family N-acetyltransferase [Risungbinella massiliensis]
MQYYIVDKLDDDEKLEQVLEILIQCDQEFFPSLSSKRGSDTISQSTRLLQYLSEKDLEGHGYVLVEKEGKVIGFCNFYPTYVIDELPNFPEHLHVDTVCVLPEYRGQGIAKNIYAKLMEYTRETKGLEYIGLATWSENWIQEGIMSSLEFEEIGRLENARDQGVDTVWYGKKIR